jgi:hypothetical protein
MSAFVLAQAGDEAAARRLTRQLDAEFPEDTLVQKYWLPCIRAAIAEQQRNPNEAVEELKPAGQIELSEPVAYSIFLCPVYLRGEAYLMLHDGHHAAAEFQKFIDHRGLVANFPWGALARLGLGRAYALSGNHIEARGSYDEFLTLWKGADSDIPILKQAKAEYAKLQ